jgi:hypothetical protein
VRSSHHGVDLFDGDPHHQISTDNAAAHPAAAEEREPTEHLAFTDVMPIAERPADTLREELVVCHPAFRYWRSAICLP